MLKIAGARNDPRSPARRASCGAPVFEASEPVLTRHGPRLIGKCEAHDGHGRICSGAHPTAARVARRRKRPSSASWRRCLASAARRSARSSCPPHKSTHVGSKWAAELPMLVAGRTAAPLTVQELPAKMPLSSSGASRTRTGDLLGAIQALFQLSYSPERGAQRRLDGSVVAAGRRARVTAGDSHRPRSGKLSSTPCRQ